MYTGQLVKERIHFEDRASGPYPSRYLGYLGLLNVPSEIGEVLKAGPVYHLLVTIHPSLGRCHPSHRQERRRHRLGPLRRYMAPLLLHIVTDPRRRSRLPRPCARQVGFPRGAYRILWSVGGLGRATGAAESTVCAVLDRVRVWECVREVPLNEGREQMLNLLLDDLRNPMTNSPQYS